MSEHAFPIITVKDLAATQRFYEALGFAESYRFPSDGEPAFVTLERGGSAIGLGVSEGDDADRFALWVYVDDVDDAFATARSTGAAAVAEPRDEAWGERVASIRDPDGTLVHLGAPKT